MTLQIILRGTCLVCTHFHGNEILYLIYILYFSLDQSGGPTNQHCHPLSHANKSID